MKNLFKSKNISAFLLTMIMFVSLFFFSSCAIEEEKLLFKIVYRPFASSICSESNYKTYETIIQDDIEKTANNIITRVVGAFGLGDIEIEKTDGTKEILRPESNENYYTNLLGISNSNSNYKEIIAKITQTTDVLYLSGAGDGKRILILSNYSVTKDDANFMVSYNEDDSGYTQFIAETQLMDISSNQKYKYGDIIYENCVYLNDLGSNFAFIFVGGYAYSNTESNRFNYSNEAENYVTSLLSTNYNNIQQTISRVYVSDGVNVKISSSKWKYSLDNDHGIFDPNYYLNEYKNHYQKIFEVELANAILTRSENKLSDELKTFYLKATRANAGYSDQDEFILKASNYIDHLGLIEEEIEPLLKFLLEKTIGLDISEGNKLLQDTCKKLLTEAQKDVSYTPILEVLSYKGTELEEITIDGYIQSVIILKEDEPYDFFAMWCLFALEEDSQLTPFNLKIRHQQNGQVKEFPVAIDEQDAKEGSVFIDMEEVLESGSEVTIDICKDPIKPDLNSKKISIVHKAKEYKDKFIYSKSENNTKGFGWYFNNEESNFVEIIFGYDSLCVNQNVNIDALFF